MPPGAFTAVVQRQRPGVDEAEVTQVLGDYLANKIGDRLDSGGSLDAVFEFLASPTQPGAFVLDPIDVQMFIRRPDKAET